MSSITKLGVREKSIQYTFLIEKLKICAIEKDRKLSLKFDDDIHTKFTHYYKTTGKIIS